MGLGLVLMMFIVFAYLISWLVTVAVVVIDSVVAVLEHFDIVYWSLDWD
jgi:hypothetical protein